MAADFIHPFQRHLFYSTLMLGIALPFRLFWVQVLCQCYSIYMLRGNDSLCATQLMKDPLTTNRIRTFAWLTSQAFLPFAAINPLPEGGECSFILTLLLGFFGIMIPALFFIPPKTMSRFKVSIFRVGLVLTWAATVVITKLTFP